MHQSLLTITRTLLHDPRPYNRKGQGRCETASSYPKKRTSAKLRRHVKTACINGLTAQLCTPDIVRELSKGHKRTNFRHEIGHKHYIEYLNAFAMDFGSTGITGSVLTARAAPSAEACSARDPSSSPPDAPPTACKQEPPDLACLNMLHILPGSSMPSTLSGV